MTGVVFSPEEAFAGRWGLVVTGGPGSGKSWLACQYARMVAAEALARLVRVLRWLMWSCRW